MKICVIIPTYNEAKSIERLVKQLIGEGFNIIVVDDGSKDNSGLIASRAGARVINNERNLGKGAALRKGFKYALDYDYDAVITMDGDGQHHPEDLEKFCEIAQDDNVAIVVGNRMFQVRNMPLARIITNKLMSIFISFICRQNIPDTQCGFRLIKKEVLEKLDLKTEKYEIESEVLIKASKTGHRIKSVNIHTIYGTEKSQINPVIDAFRFILYILREYFEK